MCRAGWSRRVTPSRQPESPTSGRSATTCAARPATAKSRTRKLASPTSSDWVLPAASIFWRDQPPEVLTCSKAAHGQLPLGLDVGTGGRGFGPHGNQAATDHEGHAEIGDERWPVVPDDPV